MEIELISSTREFSVPRAVGFNISFEILGTS